VVSESTANWLLTLAYDGTVYAGWQQQPEQATVQGLLHEQLARLFAQPVRAEGCSRTDAGVHALAQQVTVRPPASPAIAAENCQRALGHALPPDIRLLALREMDDNDFHARFSGVGKAYVYVLHNGGLASPFLPRYCWAQTRPLDVEAMRRASAALIGRHDFTTFSAASPQAAADPVRTIARIELMAFGDFVCIVVVGDGFLYRMVRRIAGCLVSVGIGRLAAGQVAGLLDACDRNAGFRTAPPQGLFLDAVFYNRREQDDYACSQLPFLRLAGLS
jgi:tRNA pseudouridine38-40 synthase